MKHTIIEARVRDETGQDYLMIREMGPLDIPSFRVVMNLGAYILWNGEITYAPLGRSQAIEVCGDARRDVTALVEAVFGVTLPFYECNADAQAALAVGDMA